jgi:hypothetical protein
MERSQRFLFDELDRLGAINVVVSTNVLIRIDGRMYADYMDRRLDDPGVAIYFMYRGDQIAMCCDKFSFVWENVYALGKGIEALRGMERWGVSDFLKKAFSGFKELPGGAGSAPPPRDWWTVFGYPDRPGRERWDKLGFEGICKDLAKKLHPDKPGGSVELFQEFQRAKEEGEKYFA